MPGVITNITNAPAPTSRPTDTGKLFAVGACERGSTTAPIIVHSLPELKAQIGTAVAGSFLVSGAEEFFQEGGATLIVGRAVGATAVIGSAQVENIAKNQKVLNAFAKSLGAWGNKLEVKITTESSKFAVTVLEEGVELEKITGLATAAAAVEWSLNSLYVTLVELRNENPGEGTIKLAGGSDGEAVSALGSAQYGSALKLFAKDLGCGQVAVFGVTSQAVQELVLAHCEERDRVALLDGPVGASAAELKAVALALRTKTGARRGVLFSSWATIPGLSPNTTRRVPWSAVQAGIISRNDALSSPPAVNEASAGINGRTRNVLSLVSEFSRIERDELSEARVIPIRVVPVTGIETYGNVTLVSPSAEPAWESFTAARLFMYVAAECESILEKFVFAEIDPHGLLFARASGALTAFLESLGSQLFNLASEAVNTGPQVNTPETIHKKQLNASVLVQPSPSAETVTLNITAKGV